VTGQVIVEFTARGAARDVSAAIEACAAERRIVSALVVPWESDASTLRMAVTSTTGDGWALEHTDLGTITLDSQGDVTRVAVIPHDADRSNPDSAGADAQNRLSAVLVSFAREIERKLASPGLAR
jgi:hypothetical protein